MTSSNKIVKITARTALGGNWIFSIFAFCIVLFTYLIISNSVSVLDYIFGKYLSEIAIVIGTLFILLPLTLGLLRYFWRLLFGSRDNPISVFYYFSDKLLYKKSMTLIFSLFIKFLLWYIILNIPLLITKFMAGNFIYDMVDIPIPVWTANLTNVGKFLKIISSVLIFFIMMRYYLSPMLFIADDNIESAEAIHMSTVISKKTSVDYIYLILSFFGWFLLSILIIPVIFVLPYFITSYLVHSRFAVADYNLHIKNSAEASYPSYTA